MAFIYWYRVPGLALADLIAPSVAMGLAFGRIGCFLNGCCFGGPCDLPWALSFPADSGPHEQQIRLGQVYGLLVVADRDHRPVIGNAQAGTPPAVVGLQAGDVIESIGGHKVTTLSEAQHEFGEAFLAGGPLELTTASNLSPRPALPGTHERNRPVHPTQLYTRLMHFCSARFLLPTTRSVATTAR